ncbi:hypothetical protein GB931_04125 [Modestobacter sp. I12A-02628]|uniref:Uncharacterized protein n=1 Tax=Goekera deserti TaxID=2497753 RepID=A0A7K3WIP4_9ACTN|nr:hypothetical protein [Goekera deserti]MPQ97124.1 hypothetical protein [Goekera deserti]NDI46558.1 hypothetical protein [Goekera deserti]NEL56314.1 hypothetical protein [Goekera deserti]
MQAVGGWNAAAAAMRSIGGFQTTLRAAPGEPDAAPVGRVDAAERAARAAEDDPPAESPTIALLRRQLEVAQAQLEADIEARASEAVIEQDRMVVQMAAAALATALAEQLPDEVPTVDQYI